MQPYEDDLYPTLYEDEDYAIWIDVVRQIVNIFLRERGLTLHLTYEDFQVFREAMNNPIWVDTDEQIVDLYLEESGLTVRFAYEDFEAFRDIVNILELTPKWWICWN